MKRLLETLFVGTAYLCRVYARGCNVVFRAAVACLIVWFFTLPLKSAERLFERISFPEDDVLAGGWIRLLLISLVFLVYLPPVFYVAASWVGFCPRIEENSEERDESISAGTPESRVR